MVATGSRKSARIPPRRGLAVALLAACLAFFAACSRDRDDRPSPGAETGTAAGGYAGSERCAACHARNYHFWKGTKHANMLREPAKDTVVGDFQGGPGADAPRASAEGGLEFARFLVKDGTYHVELPAKAGGWDDFPVAFVLGGARRQMYLWAAPDGRLMALPVQWNVREGRWSKAMGPDGAGPGGAPRDWLQDCAPCHVTGLGTVAPGKDPRTAWSENSIGCEACHGPGARHAQAKDPGKSDTIFNPGNFHDEARAAMVCGRCHTRGAFAGKGPSCPQGSQAWEDCLPGFTEVSGKDHRLRWPDGSARANREQYDDFRKSDMFGKGVKCWSCHDPHKTSENSASSLRLAGNALCRSCHVRNQGPASLSHALHDEGSCQACHMPLTASSGAVGGRGDIASHSFQAILPSATVELGGGDPSRQPNSCTLCHYHDKQPPAELDGLIKARVRARYQKPADKAGPGSGP